MPGIGKCNSASNYILIFGKLFHIYKLVRIDLKLRILIASFLLALLLNNNVNDFFLVFRALRKKKRKGHVVYMLKAK